MKQRSVVNILFLAPVVFTFIMIIIVPFSLGIYYSLTDWNGVSPNIHFVGFKNFSKLFNTPDFIHSFLITVGYTIINVILVNIVSFTLSLIVTSKVKFRNFYRAGFFVPYLIGGIVLGYIWQFIMNNILVSLGTTYGIEMLQSSFLSRPETVIWVMSVVNTWQFSGYIMLIYVAAIQSIPKSLMEAASVDGAGFVRNVFNILIPMMANAFTISLFLTLTNSFKQFDMNLTLTNGGPATRFMGVPVKASQLLAMNIFDTATANKMAEAQAKAVVLFVVLVVVSLIQVSNNKKKEVEM
ncbi:MAG: maltose transport system permease protein [Sphaerochaeta sp.]|jgi:raffinose/stachyose/melibiose transport system permease protein|uniref:Sugar ABC transporter permease n=1 Tax=Sphaerochaeta halotolerans TaxID=2293840 RepID=A0A372MGE9_9SPIR|nr:sugar ABC transporter permease [Sphaerochaeta halotolerans]MDK2859657.1 maltose transport system permease protein [Sphaerochaeta sp.]MDN5334059.1 maltose transport system permease protein [Sphaerochaeta sp.]RFU94879.1 sugar ABC transporter permease [Sphaerochaeta halotolerans]